MATKPTLHEIAAMPFPASQNAMRENYNPHWGKPVPEGAGELKAYRVAVEYSYTAYETTFYDVEAYDESEAEDLAADVFDNDSSIEDGAEFEGAQAKPAKARGAA